MRELESVIEEAVKIRKDILQCEDNNSRLGDFLGAPHEGHCDVCVNRIKEALNQAQKRGRREENEACDKALCWEDFFDYCKKAKPDWEPSGSEMLAITQAYKYAKRTIRSRMEEK